VKNKQIQKWAMGAEIISAVAVVATIGFLAFQTMENTNSLQAQMFQQLMHDTNEWRASVSDPASVAMRTKFRDEGLESLTRLEQYEYRMANLVLWGIYESAFFANERGVLGELEWTRFEAAICRNRKRDADIWDLEGVAPFPELLTPTFVNYIEKVCN
jgi:hypothetical protein